MHASNDQSDPLQPRPPSPVRRLSRRYLLVLVAVAMLVVLDQAIIQPQLVRLNLYAPAINLAGRQRMLSQNIAKQALAMTLRADSPDAVLRHALLTQLVDEWTAAHESLLAGDAALTIEPISDKATRAALRRLEPSMAAIEQAAGVIAAPNASLSESRQALATILTEEPRYLEGMERAVQLLESAARRRVAFLRTCGIALMLVVLGLLAGAYYVALRPALRIIRQQFDILTRSETRHRELSALLSESRDLLELRVARRTAELVDANRALQHQILEREAAQQRMRELSAQLAHASRVTALGQLATGLAHEINQPLASITNYADILELRAAEGRLDTGETLDTLSQLKRAALRAGQIVRRMRNFIRPAAAEESAPLEIGELIREVCELCRPQIEQAGATLSIELPDEPTWIEADSLEIQQVLVNLLQNAAQAVVECPSELRSIHLRSHVEGNQLHVEVADSGPGFDSAADEAFAPFYTTKPEGLGMGLAISRSILERNRGRLWGRNRAGGGAVVGFCLPLSAIHESSDRELADGLCR